MGTAEAKLAKDLAIALVDLFPLGSIGRKLLEAPIGYAFDRGEAARGKQSIAKIAAAVAAEIYHLPDAPNPGSAASASFDVITILKQSGLGPDLLMQLNLDPHLVQAHLLKTGAQILRDASAQRRRFITDGLTKIAAGIVEVAPELPGTQLAFMRAILRSRNGRASDA